MKVALVMIMCSQIAGDCMKPHFLGHFDNLYDCLIGGYTEAIEKTEEIGKKEIIRHEIIVKFNSYYDTKTLEKGA